MSIKIIVQRLFAYRILSLKSLYRVKVISIFWYGQLLLLIYFPTPAHFFSVSSHVPNHTSTIGSSWHMTSDNNSCISRSSIAVAPPLFIIVKWPRANSGSTSLIAAPLLSVKSIVCLAMFAPLYKWYSFFIFLYSFTYRHLEKSCL
jgi:hypothetical protein